MEKPQINNTRLGYSPDEFSRAFGISLTLTRKLIKNGQIKAIRMGERRWIIPVGEMERILKEGL